MKNKKRNSNKFIVEKYKKIIFPKLTHEEAYSNIRTISFRKKDLDKLNKLSNKWCVSRSAFVRILIDNYNKISKSERFYKGIQKEQKLNRKKK